MSDVRATVPALDRIEGGSGGGGSRGRGSRGSGQGRALALAAVGYLALTVVVWWGVWSSHPTSTTTCGCGDSALFLWFFAWPAHALAHGLDPLYSTAMSYPGGVNLLANTSELALGTVLAPVTWIFGPVASMNVAITLAPALSALAMYVLVRRWVSWSPAAFAAGLLYGFSPLVLVSLSDAHLMLGWAVVPPLMVLCLDDLVFGRRRGPVVIGVALGLLAGVQFFVGTEILLLLGIIGAVAGVAMLAYGIRHSDAVRAGARRVLVGLAAAAGTAMVLLAYPTWFALAGPAHTSGRVWPTLELGLEGTTVKGYLWPTPVSTGFSLFTHRVGGYQGPTISGQYVGLGIIAVAVLALLMWRRDRRLWFFGMLALASAVLSLGASRSVWLPWQILSGLPLFENIIPSRFLVVVYLSLAVMLGIAIDRTYLAVRRRMGSTAAPDGVAVTGATDTATRRWAPPLAGLVVALVALGPIADYLAVTVPMVTQPVRSPAWVTRVAPRLPDHQVLLVFPVPYQLIESAMAWQAVGDFPYDMVGGGGPGGVIERAGRQRTGADAIARASFSFTGQVLRPGDVTAARRALTAWGVTGVVLPDERGLPAYDQVTSVPYTVAFMTAVVGRAPERSHGSWVWSGIAHGMSQAPGPTPAALADCTALGAPRTPASVERVAACVLTLA